MLEQEFYTVDDSDLSLIGWQKCFQVSASAQKQTVYLYTVRLLIDETLILTGKCSHWTNLLANIEGNIWEAETGVNSRSIFSSHLLTVSKCNSLL